MIQPSPPDPRLSQHTAPRPGAGCCRVGITVGSGQGTGTQCHLSLGGCQQRRPRAVATCLPQEGFIAGFGIGKQLTQQVLGRELEVHPHPRISQLGAVQCHRPALGIMGLGIWGQPEDRLRLRSLSRNGDTSLHRSQGCFPWGTPRERISSCPSQVGWVQHWQVGFSQSLRGSGSRGRAGKCRVQAAACPFCQPATRPPDPALPGPAGLSRTERKSLCHFSGRR